MIETNAPGTTDKSPVFAVLLYQKTALQKRKSPRLKPNIIELRQFGAKKFPLLIYKNQQGKIFIEKVMKIQIIFQFLINMVINDATNYFFRFYIIES